MRNFIFENKGLIIILASSILDLATAVPPSAVTPYVAICVAICTLIEKCVKYKKDRIPKYLAYTEKDGIVSEDVLLSGSRSYTNVLEFPEMKEDSRIVVAIPESYPELCDIQWPGTAGLFSSLKKISCCVFVKKRKYKCYVTSTVVYKSAVNDHISRHCILDYKERKLFF